MRVFGPRPWGLAIDDPDLVIATPVGESCLYCDEVIAAGDSGLILPHFDTLDASSQLRVQHRECYLRGILGSVGHQMRTCSCYGGTEEDQPDLTRRQSARLACKLAGLDL